MKYVVMVKMRIAEYDPERVDQKAREDLETMFSNWIDDPELTSLRRFRSETIQEMKGDAKGFLKMLWNPEELEFIAEGETSEATEKIWTYFEDPTRITDKLLSFRASLNRDDKVIKLIYFEQGCLSVYDATIHDKLSQVYDEEMPVQLTKHSLHVEGINGEPLQEHVIQQLEELRQKTGGELLVNDQNAQVTFEPKFFMPVEKAELYQQLNQLGQEVVTIEMNPLTLYAEDAFYYEIAQFESRKLKIYSMSI
ncbi:hypothetical protein SANA_07700 [Gottschalkiaceae bacterium SANA]|nr:hypothetical protein SANA_07700 [Gottschalkiaceae bacterium SANA]